MTRKKRSTRDEYDWGDLDPEEQTQRKAGVRRHRANQKGSKDPLVISETPWTQVPKKGGKKNG